jgi:hypothetical protein
MPLTHRSGRRTTAATLLLLGLVLLVQLPHVWSAAPYVGVLDLLCGAVSLLSGGLLWRRGSLEVLVVAAIAVALALAGQLLAATVGLPGASPLHGFGMWAATAVAVTAAAAALLVWDLLHPVA